MADGVYYNVLSPPGSPGLDPHPLPDDFDPKIVLLAASYNEQEEVVSGHSIMSNGMGTYDGGVVQQWNQTVFVPDAVSPSSPARGLVDTALLRGYSDQTPTVDYRIDLTSLGSGAGSEVVLDWVDLPTDDIRVHMLVLGGPNILAARTGWFGQTANVATQDIALPVSWGHPNFFFISGGTGAGSAVLGDFNSHGIFGFGAAKSATERVHSSFTSRSGVTTEDVKARVQDRFGYGWNAVVQDGPHFDLDDPANWPTDGFRIAYASQAPTNARNPYAYTAVKLADPSLWTIGRTSSAYSRRYIPGSVNPKGAILFGINYPSTADGGSGDLDADNASWWMGFTDGFRQGSCGVVMDDAFVGINDGRFHSESKAIKMMLPGADPPTMITDAEVYPDGAGLQAVYSSPDIRAREYGYVIFGEEPVAEPIYPLVKT